jgi:Tfp pilus assembly protein PilN
MAIQFNLLPDIKIQYLKAKRQKHLVVLGSVAAIAISLSVFVLLVSIVYGLQKKNLADLDKDIKAASKELKETPELTKILTVQNQLRVLPSLHDKKVVSSRLYDYLSQVTPVDASINKLNVDFELNTITISGSAKDLATVNTYTDTLKFTNYKTKKDNTEKKPFLDVVLSAFGRDTQSATYDITFKFDPLIFDNTQEVTLAVPQIISTRSEVDKPTALFQKNGEEQ